MSETEVLEAIDSTTQDFKVFGTADQRAALFADLAQAKGEFSPIEKTKHVKVKTRSGDTYEFDYAPLDVVIAATDPALAKHGLAIIEPLSLPDRTADELTLRLLLTHKAGGCILSVIRLAKAENIQQTGSAITYLRRYARGALLGVAPEDDDDGNQADGNTAQASQRQPSRGKPPSPPQNAPARQQAPKPPPEREAAPQGQRRPSTPPPPVEDPRQTKIPGADIDRLAEAQQTGRELAEKEAARQAQEDADTGALESLKAQGLVKTADEVASEVAQGEDPFGGELDVPVTRETHAAVMKVAQAVAKALKLGKMGIGDICRGATDQDPSQVIGPAQFTDNSGHEGMAREFLKALQTVAIQHEVAV